MWEIKVASDKISANFLYVDSYIPEKNMVFPDISKLIYNFYRLVLCSLYFMHLTDSSYLEKLVFGVIWFIFFIFFFTLLYFTKPLDGKEDFINHQKDILNLMV